MGSSVEGERNHLIHRKRSPFPYKGKDLSAPKMSVSFHNRALSGGNASLAAKCNTSFADARTIPKWRVFRPTFAVSLKIQSR